jgi:hypothetical protein
VTHEERLSMQRHEAWISQPVSTLFPDITKGRTRVGVCIGCGIDFIVNTKGGPNQKWCTSKCRITKQKKTTRTQGPKP